MLGFVRIADDAARDNASNLKHNMSCGSGVDGVSTLRVPTGELN